MNYLTATHHSGVYKCAALHVLFTDPLRITRYDAIESRRLGIDIRAPFHKEDYILYTHNGEAIPQTVRLHGMREI